VGEGRGQDKARVCVLASISQAGPRRCRGWQGRLGKVQYAAHPSFRHTPWRHGGDTAAFYGNYPFYIGNAMCCDSAASADPTVEAGAPEAKIEITPEMIEAGACSLATATVGIVRWRKKDLSGNDRQLWM
jgi:hypothetical protein